MIAAPGLIISPLIKPVTPMMIKFQCMHNVLTNENAFEHIIKYVFSQVDISRPSIIKMKLR